MALSLGLGLGLSFAPSKGGGGVAKRLLDLIKDDTATALIWGYQNTDRRFATSTGGANPAVDGDFVGLDLDDGKWGGKTFAQVMAGQPERSINTPDASGTTANMTTSPDSAITIINDAGSPAGSGKAFRLANAQGANRFADISTTGILAGKLYLLEFYAKANSARSETMGFSGSGASNITIAVTPEWRKFSALLISSSNGQSIYIRAAAGNTTDFVLNLVKEVPSRYALQGTSNSRPKWQSGPKPYLIFDGVDDCEDVQSLVPGAAGTMVSAFRAGAAASPQHILDGGTSTGSKVAALLVNVNGHPTFGFSDNYPFVATSVAGQDCVLVQTWGGGRRRCYFSGAPNPLVIDEARAANMDGAGSSFKIGSNRTAGGNWLNGRHYGSLIRNVETSDADVRNILLPAFQGLYQ